ncbi:glutamyl-tRNA(Gln) amidotransferase subunit B, mitochondrial [Neodiprion virginianus]|uniref:glutamyl-tRNA(Gln) amidotransferase subunit B, mitochondrial n=1 Tax=Neodiprion fabricii TaxID=2872261 RepID=UPI001ED94563|nr:glutamyl-tRNA(Gln) amidotransferase subunit B, mitochondrial [Neodiprion fabricii]XP_046605963.1 glutamyl-tRNA(Gln) amidotransferase subunit B, mitochondrial [Neodiprion virginianus]
MRVCTYNTYDTANASDGEPVKIVKIYLKYPMNYTNCWKINPCIKRWRENKPYLRMLKHCFGTEAKSRAETKKKWRSVVGLEIHAQIQSNSKLFSGSSTMYGSPINSNVSFFDCATPGTLPVLNKRCVEAGILTALALSCKVNEVSLFDRKHYFYADLPAGYQITQQRQALAIDGELNFQVYTPGIHPRPYSKVSKIKQLQLEQDSGKSLHDLIAKRSLVDLNRAGIPLMELVFEPDLSDGEEAAALVKEIVLILKRLGTCSCKMEEGALRVDANISVNRPGEKLGTRTEVKNIGSIRSVAAAVKFEIDRQIKEIENGGTIINETRSWDTEIRKTVPMRDKEEKQDYRFMPEPNLPPLHVHVTKEIKNKYGLVDVPLLQESLPELPEETRYNLKNNFGLDSTAAIILTNENNLLNIFEAVVKEDSKRKPKLVSNILINQLLTVVNRKALELDTCILNAQHIGELVDMLQNKTINLTTAENVLEEYITESSMTPKQIVEKNNWTQITDEHQLTQICKNILLQRADVVKKYKAGKTKVFRALVGAVAQETKNRADMATVVNILKKLLDE